MNATSGSILLEEFANRLARPGQNDSGKAKKGHQMKPKTPAYSVADLALWQQDMVRLTPPAFVTPGFVNAFDIGGFRIGHTATGMALVARPSEGVPVANIFLNPVVAFALRDGILMSGQAGGWLDANGQIVPGSTR